jgi:limonene-1,2-epoxide hydrolase
MAATISSPVGVVRRFMADMERLNYDSALRLVSDGWEYVNPPPFPVVHGPAGIRGILEPFFAPTLENEFKVGRLCAVRTPSWNGSTATASLTSGSSFRSQAFSRFTRDK